MTDVDARSTLRRGQALASIPLWLRGLQMYCRMSPVNRGKFRLVLLAYRRFQIPDLEILSTLDFVVKIKLRLRVWVDFNIFCIGLYEHYLARFFISQLRRDTTFLDVGAYIGQYALLAAHHAPAGFAYAFEPLPETANRLQENVRLNEFQNCEVVPSAVGAANGVTTLFESPQPFMSSTIADHGVSSDAIKVPVTTVDAFCTNRNISRVDIMKVDVEEAEDVVIAGATRMLDQFRPLVLLEVGRNASLHEPTLALAHLAALGYRFFRLRLGRLMPVSGQIQAAENVVAVPENHPLTHKRQI